jgi:catechol 2,3-dioxygenase-like lactoylglutathione lyase family enzyme
MALDVAPAGAGTETGSPDGPEVISGEGLRGHTGQARLADVPVAPRVRLRNVDHLALNTVDMRQTLEFYCGVLEMRLLKVVRTPADLSKSQEAGAPPYPSLRHYFFDMGEGGTVAFVEYPPGTPKGDRDLDATMQHVAFNADRASFHRVCQQLDAHSIARTEPVYMGGRSYSVYFFDPNGIRLEVSADLEHDDCPRFESSLQTAAHVRAELATLYPDPAELERVLGYAVVVDRKLPSGRPTFE